MPDLLKRLHEGMACEAARCPFGGGGMSHARQHSGFATAASRRNEQFVLCSKCGQINHRVRRYQAAPLEVSDDVPEFWYLVATAVLAAPIVWTLIFVIALFVTPGAAR
jgi:hypothetical protein